MRTAPHMLAGLLLGLPGLIAASLFAGCAHSYRVKIDALNDPAVAPAKSYRLSARDPAVEQKDPRYAEAARLVRAALATKGMYEAPNADEAEILVEIDYGVGPPRVRVNSDPDPMIGPTVLAVPRVPIRTARGVPFPSGIHPESGFDPFYHRGDTLSATTVHEKHLSIVARENRREGDHSRPGPEIWRVDVSVEDEGEGIAEVLPIMAGAAAEHIGTTTERQVRTVTEDEPTVALVKRGL